jgi:alpha-tubulin suppressor-like RCC1 family protein
MQAHSVFWSQKEAGFLTKTTPSKLFAWGQGAFGKLGLGSDGSQFDPKFISALDGVTINDLSTGKTITACIDESGNILTWGKPINVISNNEGSFGLWH